MKLPTALILFAVIAFIGILISGIWVNPADTSSAKRKGESTESAVSSELAAIYRSANWDAEPQPKPQTPWTVAVPEKATFGTGCFWCTEAIFEELEGVMSVVCGYSGGHVENPTYEEVSEETTGHAEVVQITYDPQKISYATLLQAFWLIHDPTSLNKQGKDVGTRYRSAVFYHNEEQRKLAEAFKKKLDKSNTFGAPIVTEITKFETFFAASDFHQDFFATNGQHPYCNNNIVPKLEKFRKTFARKLKRK